MSVASVGSGGAVPSLGELSQNLVKPAQMPFGKLIEHLLGDANAQQLQADQAVKDLVTGKVDNVHEVVLEVVKADLAFRTVLEVRNRFIDAYQEVMRMQL